jgi:2'-5' RNA ligase
MALERLAVDIRARVDRILPAGEMDRKPFRPHLTIARIKRPLSTAQRRLLPQVQFVPWDPVPINEIRLVASKLQPQGAQHSDLALLPLGAPQPDTDR